ncbi:MAG TPA: M67 family metallopeptidase [Actinomycetota bacterium]|nr:M67 family metallopeptidase [Actinomycetota bacterium]
MDEMIRHCVAERPNEACGLLVTKAGEVTRVILMTNAAQSPTRYAFDSKETLVTLDIEDEGFEWSVFHSHTRTGAYPSPTDVKHATEATPYVIVSLAEDEPDVRAFRIRKSDWRDAHGEVVEVPIEIAG